MSEKLLQKLLKEADQKKAQLDSFRPLPGELIKELNTWFKVELTYSSNAIEGNTFTSDETAMMIEKDLPIDGKSLREHLEIVGHATAFEYVLDLSKCNRCDLTLPDILNIHKLIFDRIDEEHAGLHKNVEVTIGRPYGRYDFPIKFQDSMTQFLDWMHGVTGHPIIIAIEAHYKLIALQPFRQGNGVTARLLMNLLLLQKGYEPAIIWPEDRDFYHQLLIAAEKTNNLEPLYEFITKQVIQSFDLYLEQTKPSL